MKNIISAFLICFSIVSMAQTPESFKYQAVVRDASGVLLNNQPVGLRISIIENSVSGPSVYTETFNLSTNDYGLANISIGTGNIQSGVFSTIDWGSTSHYIQVELDATGGSNYQLVGTSQLLSVPYALYAKNVENDQIDDADSDPNNENQTLSISGSDITISNGNTVTLPGSSGGNLNDLLDVNAPTPQTNEILLWNGTEWVAGDICSLFNFYYLDSDNDGFGNSDASIYACSAPNGYVSDSTDCNDNNVNINPNGTETCDNIDNNCDGQVDEGLTINTYYFDADGDGYGNGNNSITSCSQPVGYVLDETDCDDFDPNINPGQSEVCDGTDNDCDGMADDGLTINTYYFDGDMDSYGDPSNSITACIQPNNYILDGSDCDDNDPSIHPGATEIPNNGIDEDCDGTDPCYSAGTPCDDGLFCTTNDVYDGNCNCIGTATDCDDGDPNTMDSCDEMNDLCDHICNVGAMCDDGIACTFPDQIDANCNCIGTPSDAICDDGDPNTTDSCDPVLGCQHTCNVGATCDDGNICTHSDQLDASCNCVGTPYFCDDGDANTSDSCDGAGGCVFTCNVGAICSDGNPCTENDKVDPSCNCVGTPKNCDDGDPSTTDSCDPTTGNCIHTP